MGIADMELAEEVMGYLMTPGRWPTSAADIAYELGGVPTHEVLTVLRELESRNMVGCRVTDGNDGWYYRRER